MRNALDGFLRVKDVVLSLFLRGPCVMEVDVACPRGAMTCAIGEVFVS